MKNVIPRFMSYEHFHSLITTGQTDAQLSLVHLKRRIHIPVVTCIQLFTCKRMQNLIKIYHVVQELWASLLTGNYGGWFVPFRYFVFSPGVMARRQDEITPSEKTK